MECEIVNNRHSLHLEGSAILRVVLAVVPRRDVPVISGHMNDPLTLAVADHDWAEVEPVLHPINFQSEQPYVYRAPFRLERCEARKQFVEYGPGRIPNSVTVL